MLFSAAGCKEDLGITKPQTNDGKAPGAVSNVQIQNRPGTAKLTYKIPGDNDVLYIKAVYEIRPGVMREVRSSKTNDSLIVDGFGEAKEYNVQLYAVDNGENSSVPVSIKVSPLTPPLKSILDNLNIIDDFGGVGILYDNPLNAEISITVMKKTAAEKDILVNTFYTKAKNGAFNVRGYPVTPVVFGFFIKDKFGNITETVYKTITPIEEVRLDRALFKEFPLPNDIKNGPAGWTVVKMWDNLFNDGNGFHSADATTQVMPLSVSFDLGVKAKLSRFKYFPRTVNDAIMYNHYNLKRFELWGSSTARLDGNWDDWVLLGSYESVKPSKLPVGQLTNEDRAYAKAGEEFNVPSSAPAVKYIRIKALESWSGLSAFQVMEMQLWGKVIQ